METVHSLVRVAAAVIIRDGKVLLADRPANKPPQGWEFPGGKLEPGETPAAALIRELREELAVNVRPSDQIYLLRTPKLHIHFLRAELASDAVPTPCEGQHCRWIELVPECRVPLLTNDLEFWKFLTNSIK